MNEKEFEKIYRGYFGYVYSLTRSKLPDSQVEDVIHEVFLALWKIASVSEVDNRRIKSLIYRITLNKIADVLRQVYRFREYEMETSDYESSSISELNLSNCSVDQPASKHLKSLLDQLSDKFRAIFELKYSRGLSYGEIASELGITANYAKVLNNRLIKKLKKLW